MVAINRHDIDNLATSCESVIESLRSTVFAPEGSKQLDLRFSMTTASQMCGRSDNLIREAEKDGRLPPPNLDAKGRRKGYTLGDVNSMRQAFGTLPWRRETDEPVVIACQNFKGGVAKSTISTHFSQYLALQGYRVLVVDCDSQASTTTWMGFNPDLDIDQDATLLPYLIGEGAETLQSVIRKTHWDGIDLIPANLALYNAEYIMAGLIREDNLMLDRLRVGLMQVAKNYDVVILDPPPALGMISLAVLRAADALVIPTPPTIIDFASTCQFLRMLEQTLGQLEKIGLSRDYKFIRLLASKVSDNSTQGQILRMMQETLGNKMLASQLKHSAEIDNASLRLMTVYELSKPTGSRETYQRARAYLDAVGRELETTIRRQWPSHHDGLRREGAM
jgi:chromosome partitioning protein